MSTTVVFCNLLKRFPGEFAGKVHCTLTRENMTFPAA